MADTWIVMKNCANKNKIDMHPLIRNFVENNSTNKYQQNQIKI